jgi:anti-sigma B factor antagonist
MFDIGQSDDGTVWMAGRLDAAQSPRAQDFLDALAEPRVLDLARLEYVSSAGLGVFLKTQKRAMAGGGGLTLINASRHIRDIFRYSGFDKIFVVRDA